MNCCKNCTLLNNGIKKCELCLKKDEIDILKLKVEQANDRAKHWEQRYYESRADYDPYDRM